MTNAVFLSDIDIFNIREKFEIRNEKTTKSSKIKVRKCRVKIAGKCAKLENKF